MEKNNNTQNNNTRNNSQNNGTQNNNSRNPETVNATIHETAQHRIITRETAKEILQTTAADKR